MSKKKKIVDLAEQLQTTRATLGAVRKHVGLWHDDAKMWRACAERFAAAFEWIDNVDPVLAEAAREKFELPE
jgi:hypothetical protein